MLKLPPAGDLGCLRTFRRDSGVLRCERFGSWGALALNDGRRREFSLSLMPAWERSGWPGPVSNLRCSDACQASSAGACAIWRIYSWIDQLISRRLIRGHRVCWDDRGDIQTGLPCRPYPPGERQMHSARTIAISVALLLIVCGAHGKMTAPEMLEHPGQVALLKTETGWRYVHFPTNLRLYTYDRDSENKSVCNEGCSSTWPPIIAPDGAEPIGHWTIFIRDDGRRQWAYKGRPVYILYHDSPNDPAGDGHDGVWRLLEP